MFKVTDWFRNTRAFLSFHISQETSMAKEAITFLDSPLLWMIWTHQFLTVAMSCQSLVSTSCSSSQVLRVDHTLIVIRQWRKMRAADS
jgi:hypothetical protein